MPPESVVETPSPVLVSPSPQPRKTRLPLLVISLMVVISVAGGGLVVYSKLKPSSSPTNQVVTNPDGSVVIDTNKLLATGSLVQSLPQFAAFNEEQTTVTPNVPQTIPDPASASNFAAVQTALKHSISGPRLDALKTTGFYLTPSANLYPNNETQYDSFHASSDEQAELYSKIAGSSDPYKRVAENTVFITSDYMLHTYHVFVDRTFQYIEQTQFQPVLTQLSSSLSQAAAQSASASKNTQVQRYYQRLTAFFAVPTALLRASSEPVSQSGDPSSPTQVDSADTLLAAIANYQTLTSGLPAEIAKQGQDEIELIMSAPGIKPSPLMNEYYQTTGEMQDYSQFKPRSHYTKNSRLRSYWRAMMWYGRQGYLTKNPSAVKESALLSGLMSTTIIDGKPALKLWESIYLPTAFFVGKSDDLSVYDYNRALASVTTGQISLADLVTDDAKFAAFSAEVAKLASPTIQSSAVIDPLVGDKSKEELLAGTKSFRFMGQRFIPDSYILSTLTQGDEKPDPETNQKLPSMPTSLMVMKLLGSARADQYYQAWIPKNAPASDKVLAKYMNRLSKEFSQLSDKDWTANMYWSWLYTLRSLLEPVSSGYPPFMQNTKWQDKSLNTALGSWTELRHDTLLYAKQSYAEMGGGPPDEGQVPPVPKGYVEPNLKLINRLIALVAQTKSGLKATGALPEAAESRLDLLAKNYTALKEIARKELANERIADSEFENLRTSYLSNFDVAMQPYDSPVLSAREVRSGLIADIHTSVPTSQILYQANGIPYTVVVLVNDANGTRLTRGIAYAHNEFTGPLSPRYSDEDWQGVVYENKSTFTKPTGFDWLNSLVK